MQLRLQARVARHMLKTATQIPDVFVKLMISTSFLRVDK
jgi:hypothetical protein